MLSAIQCSTSGDDSRKFDESLFQSIHDWKEPIPVSAVQYSAQQQKNCKYVNQQMIPFPITRNSSRARQPLSRVNVTGLLRRLQVKIENISLFKIIIKTCRRL